MFWYTPHLCTNPLAEQHVGVWHFGKSIFQILKGIVNPAQFIPSFGPLGPAHATGGWMGDWLGGWRGGGGGPSRAADRRRPAPRGRRRYNTTRHRCKVHPNPKSIGAQNGSHMWLIITICLWTDGAHFHCTSWAQPGDSLGCSPRPMSLPNSYKPSGSEMVSSDRKGLTQQEKTKHVHYALHIT